MPKLTGAEATDLAYLAECPNADDRVKVVESLQGYAREVAEVLIGRSGGTKQTRADAEAIKQWAKKKSNDMRKNKEICLYADDRTPETIEIVSYLMKEGISFSTIPTSGVVPHIVFGVTRYEGLEGAKKLVERLCDRDEEHEHVFRI